MKYILIIIVVLLIIGVAPFFILAGFTAKEITDTQEQIRKNEDDIQEMNQREMG